MTKAESAEIPSGPPGDPSSPRARSGRAVSLSRSLLGSTGLRRNIGANFVANAWSALLTIGTVPVYVRLLGVEQYGLVGFFAALQGILVLLDAGLSTTLNRYLSTLSAQHGKAREMGDTLRTLEAPYWGGSALLCLLAVAASPAAGHWFGASGLSAATLGSAVLLMGLAMGVQFPFALYSGGLLGLQRQLLLSAVTISFATLRGLGAVAVIIVSPTIQAFLVWQIAVNLAQSIATGALLWAVTPASFSRSRFSATLLRRMWKFAAHISIISVESLILTAGPRFLLSKLLTLRNFGYFSIAVVVASGLYYLVSPVFAAVFPRFTQLVELGREAELTTLYHRSCQLVSFLVLPAASVLILFSHDVLLAWTGKTSVVDGSQWLTSLLVAGTALQALVYVPYALQLASNWTKLPIYQNLAAILILLPLTVLATARLGAVGGALSWIAVNAGAVLIGIQIMHRRLLPGEKLRWYGVDIGAGLLGAGGVAVVLRLTLPQATSRSGALGDVLLAGTMALLAAGLCLPVSRGIAWRLARRALPVVL